MALAIIDDCMASTPFVISLNFLSLHALARSNMGTKMRLSSWGNKAERGLSVGSCVKAVIGVTPGALWELVLALAKVKG